ncbi:Mitotic spindle assembly checkpoint protein [Schistosoma japonicum]|uniref:Mitotic spindle assembly checkpoint protein MAD2A n=1 Tax=Schistosoma japonicum TaxID=6182 RepID=Q5DDW6_SCHJA|nr:SJCHGC08975 protein [Schistosoma japonicum]KAH8862592.1 Mitotic spindle assembly checkpoint protein MAD2A [Schistosoma japonicum]KAH8862593.1 Mitotic spindle assembly checkpoint protein MAD2A [Schistosoma japonicum]TNN19558.1 Mitotic spindle assembly checkpoint protein [Schistosoma japonicum]TNN19559.1 Mitotic spindle assembly checkpoint protein [Schistosoma japonicum]
MPTETASTISLKGSAELLTDYFFYALNSILYQRGIYPSASFKQNIKYDLSVLVTTDENLIKYLNVILDQVKKWLENGNVHRLALIIKSVKTEEVLERWQFDMMTEKVDTNNSVGTKSLAQIQTEIQGVIRQIVASNTFLPVLNNSCTFELLVYADRNINVPTSWEETGPQFIVNSAEIKLRSISTTLHRVDHTVSYKRST